MTREFELTRRKILAGVGAAGVASVGAGLGTSAYFSDTETYEGNSLMAGSLDMKAAYSAHYSDWSDDEGEGVEVRMWNGSPGTTGGPGDLNQGETGLPTNAAWLVAVDDPDQFLANTQYLPEQGDDVGDASCPDGTDAGDLEQPVIDIEDVKPGDFGEVTFDFSLCDNPGYLWLQGELRSCSENGVTEPEAEDEDENEDEPRPPEEEPEPASLWPALAAGGIPASSSLFDSEKREQVAEKVKGIAGTDSVNRKDVLKAAGAGAAGAAGVGALSGSAAGAPGDLLGEVELPGHSQGVGIAFDGTYTYVIGGGSLSGDVLQVYEPPAGGDGTATQVAEKDIVDGNGNSVSIGTLDWDRDRGQFWAASGNASEPVYLMDIGDPTDGSQAAVASKQFDSNVGGLDLMDGIAYDGETDTIWLSPDVGSEVYHFQSDGTQLGTIDPTDLDDSDATQISGIAIGSEVNGRSTLFLGRNGQSRITRHYADDGTAIEEFADLPFRVEDLACDPVTYGPEAILTKDAFDGFYVAFEVESGTCLLGGESEPEPEPDECPDVELLDAVQAAAWVDDGNNYQNGEEAPAISGSLRDVLTELNSGLGLALAGDTPAEEGGGTGRNCFSAETEHSVAFAWWVPVDHGNEIQTDSATFDLGFYTEQCRHNDGSGQPPEE